MEGDLYVVRSIPGWWALPGTTYAPPLGRRDQRVHECRTQSLEEDGTMGENCSPRTVNNKRQHCEAIPRAIEKLPTGAGDFTALSYSRASHRFSQEKLVHVIPSPDRIWIPRNSVLSRNENNKSGL